MSQWCPCVGVSCAERAGNLVLIFVVRPLERAHIAKTEDHSQLGRHRPW